MYVGVKPKTCININAALLILYHRCTLGRLYPLPQRTFELGSALVAQLGFGFLRCLEVNDGDLC